MTGTGTDTDPYIIQNVTDLQNIENDLDAYYELEGNIDASATSGWNSGAGFLPISAFTGYLDGKRYTVSSLAINRGSTNNVGLFDTINNTGSYAVKGLTITGTFTGQGRCCGFAAVVTDGLINNVHSQVNVTGEYASSAFIYDVHTNAEIKDCSASGSVTSTASTTRNRFSGFASYVLGLIEDCYATGNVTLNATEVSCGGFSGDIVTGAIVRRCSATGNIVNGNGDRIGGFVGRNTGSIYDSYARGDVAASTGDGVGGFCGDNFHSTLGGLIEDCYSTGAPTGGSNVGGLVGDNGSGTGTVTNCFWDEEASGESASDGGSGKTTAEMKIHHYFFQAGWNFSTIWSISGAINNGYPALFQITSIARRHIWVEGPSLHYFDDYGNERKILGEPVNVGWPLHSFF